MHAIDLATCLHRVRFHPADLIDDHRIFAGARARREAAPGGGDLPVGQAVLPERPENLELYKRLWEFREREWRGNEMGR